MSPGSPPVSVNAVMVWLNARFSLRLPLLPLSGFATALKKLWTHYISGPLPEPDEPLPLVIPIEGNFEGLLPEGNTLHVSAYILVGNVKFGSPDVPEVRGRQQS